MPGDAQPKVQRRGITPAFKRNNCLPRHAQIVAQRGLGYVIGFAKITQTIVNSIAHSQPRPAKNANMARTIPAKAVTLTSAKTKPSARIRE